MTFLQPVFLWGLLTLAVPIAVHLFNLRKHKKVYFSQVKFLRSVSQQVNKTQKIKHLIILFCRLLGLACLVLALSVPVWKITDTTKEDLEKPITIFLDNSLSMEADGTNGNPSFVNATNWLTELIKEAPDNTSFLFFTNDFASKDNQVYSKSTLLDRLTELDYSTSFKTSENLAEKIKYFDYPSQKLLFISDFQKTSFGSLDPLLSDSSRKIHLIQFNPAHEQNIFVDTLSLANPNIVVGETNQIRIKLKNTSKKEKYEGKVKLLINNSLVAQQKTTIEAGSKSELDIEFKVNENIPHQCQLVLEDPLVTFDNIFYFILQPNPLQNINIISSRPSKTYFEKAFSLESFFKRNTFEFGKIDYGTLAKSHVVVVDGLNKIDETLANYLAKILDNNGVLFLVPDENTTTASINQLAKSISNDLHRIKPLDDRIGQTPMPLAPPDLQNPFFEQIFSQRIDKMITPKAIKILDNLPGEKILSWQDGSAFLSHLNAKNGHIFVLATSLANESSDFGRNALFLPVLYKIATYGNSLKDKLYYTIGNDFIRFELNDDSLKSPNPVFSLAQENGIQLIPPQQLLGNTLVLKNDDMINKPGIFSLLNEKRTIRKLAINSDPKESETERWSADELKALSEKHQNLSLISPGEKPTDIAVAQIGLKEHLNLWRYFLALAILFLFLETLTLRIFN